jgi:hypothetical protein
VPKDYEYAIEVRNPQIIGPEYRAILKAHGAAHVYNHYTALPSLLKQHEAMGGAHADTESRVDLKSSTGTDSSASNCLKLQDGNVWP